MRCRRKYFLILWCNYFLNQHLFELIAHAQETATQWFWRYSNERPHSALGGITPAQKLIEAAWSLFLRAIINGEITRGVKRDAKMSCVLGVESKCVSVS